MDGRIRTASIVAHLPPKSQINQPILDITTHYLGSKLFHLHTAILNTTLACDREPTEALMVQAQAQSPLASRPTNPVTSCHTLIVGLQIPIMRSSKVVPQTCLHHLAWHDTENNNQSVINNANRSKNLPEWCGTTSHPRKLPACRNNRLAVLGNVERSDCTIM